MQRQRIPFMFDDDDLLPVAVPLERDQWDAVPRAVALTEREPPFLLQFVKENPPCNQRLPGIPGCFKVQERCQMYPEEVLYRCHETGRSVLHEATMRCSCIHIIESILEANGDLTTMLDFAFNSPLHLLFVGLKNRHVEAAEFNLMVDKLLQPQPGLIASVRNREGSCPLHLVCETPEEMVPVPVLQTLLRAYRAGASRLDSRSRIPLHVHCHRRNASPEVAQLLIDANREGLRSLDQSDESWTPLHYACSKADFHLLEVLIRADPFVAKLRSRTGETPLHVLCRQRPSEQHLPAIHLLLEAAPEVPCWKTVRALFTPLHILCRYRLANVAVVRALIACCPQAAGIPDCNAYLPIHHACEVGADPAIVKCLIESFPFGARAVTRKNDTALSLSCAANSSVETVRLLLAANPNATSTANDYGFIPLHCVSRAYHPSPEITRLVLEANPESISVLTNGDEAAIHLASSNARTSVAVIQLLTNAQGKLSPGLQAAMVKRKATNLTGSTPLHLACFRGAGSQQIEALTLAHPEWISVRNNGGYTPLQILCKSGRIDESLIRLFARLGGPGLFQTVDNLGNTPLHSAMREETSVEALVALIQAYPGALYVKTAYNDMPIHLACFRRLRPEVVHEVAAATCKGVDINSTALGSSISPLLTENTAGQTPVSIAMDEFEKSFSLRSCYRTKMNSTQERAFSVLALLTKMVHFGAKQDVSSSLSLLEACVSLHRKNIRLDPAFIRRAISIAPEEARRMDSSGNYPFHVEASIPVEKMTLLSGPSCHCCSDNCHQRIGVLGALLDIFPEAAKHRSASGNFPLGLMVQNGRVWDSAFSMALSLNPQAFHWIQGISLPLIPRILARISSDCGNDALYTLIQTRPDFLSAAAENER
ncbi:hypothetical protein ACA910_006033 [Epithemia clementina (nom. ined.)]